MSNKTSAATANASYEEAFTEKYPYKNKAELFVALSASARISGKDVYINCESFAFSGFVEGVLFGDTLVISGAKWVFETGEFTAGTWADAQPVPTGTWFVNVNKIESFGIMHK